MRAYFFRVDERVNAAFNSLLLEMERETEFSPVLLRNYMTTIICSLIPERREKKETSLCEPTDLRVLSAVKYIEDNKHLFPTCEEIAEYCHFNVKYLNRIFKKATGKTLLEYIHDIKRKDAEKLLSESDSSLRQIASELGFENEYYFNTFFKRLSGISPGEYRKLIKK
jgi:AraC-like DNA-binding protein